METKEKTITNKELDTIVNYMVVRFGYDLSVCLPYKDGADIISKMEKAERVTNYYGNELEFINKSVELNFNTIPQKEYRNGKMNLLLGLTEKQDE